MVNNGNKCRWGDREMGRKGLSGTDFAKGNIFLPTHHRWRPASGNGESGETVKWPVYN